MALLNVKIGRYNVIQNNDGSLSAKRNGEQWRDLTGDNLVLALTQRIEELENVIEEAKNCIVSAAIGDPMEVCITTSNILEEIQTPAPLMCKRAPSIFNNITNT